MAPECGLVQKHIFCVWCLYPLVFCIKENGRGKESIEVSTDVCASAVAVDTECGAQEGECHRDEHNFLLLFLLCDSLTC